MIILNFILIAVTIYLANRYIKLIKQIHAFLHNKTKLEERINRLKQDSNVKQIAICDHKDLQRIEGIYALTKVTKKGEDAVFNPRSGVPVVCRVCLECGEIKLYSGKTQKEI